jgi:hypothetical protein
MRHRFALLACTVLTGILRERRGCQVQALVITGNAADRYLIISSALASKPPGFRGRALWRS